jgi:hypothetical protein
VPTMLMKPVPHAAELAAISLLPEFSPELTDVVASLMKALVQICVKFCTEGSAYGRA